MVIQSFYVTILSHTSFNVRDGFAFYHKRTDMFLTLPQLCYTFNNEYTYEEIEG